MIIACGETISLVDRATVYEGGSKEDIMDGDDTRYDMKALLLRSLMRAVCAWHLCMICSYRALTTKLMWSFFCERPSDDVLVIFECVKM